MKVIVFGATGMLGQGVLRECLLDDQIERVLTVGRTPTGRQHPKLTELVRDDLTDFAPVEDQLTGYEACFFCLGVSSTGMNEDAYRRVTYDITVAAGQTLARLNPGSTFVYVSGQGTDSTERGRTMWARVKGRTENALLAMPLETYLFRPGYIQPMHGATSKTTLYRLLYRVTTPFYPVLRRVAPRHVTTTERVGRAMINVAKTGAPQRILENPDINSVAG
ncbi:epimerase [Rugosimonospora africana]|uniref:Epimerase n=1 Tax=Rugosimonospora africana TaxID=556532 RepID=A0A8J3VSC9_9ACTN|nr:epimerase [Rugosimonospora africana]GIH16451.1 epimerase [Rugosimonospora africana]